MKHHGILILKLLCPYSPMSKQHTKVEWEEYCTRGIAELTPILARRGFSIADAQPHIAGERFLMNAVTTTSGRKLILIGTDTHGQRVVIKASDDAGGIREIIHARTCRNVLDRIDFARDIFHAPREHAYITEHGYTIHIQEFIEQSCAFLERPIEEQFALALAAFKGQEGAHATTYKHRALIARTFGIRTAATYLENFASFRINIKNALPEEHTLNSVLEHAHDALANERIVIDQYSGFLTHTDFVPHNIRVRDNTIYLLDHSSLTFGNKYEGWARFLNFMTLYNQPLERALVGYVRANRTPEETRALRMMRIYRLGEIVWYYVRTLNARDDNNLFALNTARVHFWGDVLEHILAEREIPSSLIETYIRTREALRSEDEKRRQRGLH